jgi:predicted alpha-1,6-mannanase (GH76 family)
VVCLLKVLSSSFFSFFETGSKRDRSHDYKATASNFGASVALCQLSKVDSGNLQWRKWAEVVFKFWLQNMVRPSGQVCDGIESDGKLHCDLQTNLYSYNQGMGLGAAACLNHSLTSVLHFVRVNETKNNVLIEHLGTPCTLNDSDCLSFLGITFRFLLAYGGANDVLEASALSIVKFANADGFPNNWTGPEPEGVLTLTSQTSALSAIVNWAKHVCKKELKS